MQIEGWFGDIAKRRLEELIRAHDVRTVLEIGSYHGLSTAWFAERVERVTCVDIWTWYGEDIWDKFELNMRACGAWDKIVPVRGESHKVRDLVRTRCGAHDLVYIDADHHYEAVSRDIFDYEALAEKVLCGDDYSRAHPWYGVIEAVDWLLPDRQVEAPFWWVVKQDAVR